MAVHIRSRRCVFAALLAATLGACTGAGPRDCAASVDARASLATTRLDGDVLVFRSAIPAAGSDVQPIELLRYRSGAGCRPETVARYDEEGGPPHLEANFVHPVQGIAHLFAIVSWPVWHAGEGMRGTYYAVYAYHADGDALVLNDAVAKHPALGSGIVGTVDGAPSTFEGATREGVVAMLRRLGLD